MSDTNFLTKMQKVLVPIGSKLSNQRHLAAISAGLMATIAITMVGALFQIIASPPVTEQMMKDGGLLPTLFGGWYKFATAHKVLILTPFNMSMGIFAVIVSFTIAYNLAKSYKLKAMSAGITSMVVFLMVAAPATSYVIGEKQSILAINTQYLGGVGLFTAMIVSLVSVEITRFCIRKNIVIKMPDVVPPSLADSFSAMIPLLFNVIIIFGINVICLKAFNASIPKLIMNILSAPLGAVNSVPGMLLIMVFASLLWIFGIHGTMVVIPIIFALMIPAITGNAELVAAGKAPVFSPVLIFGAIAVTGGTGNTLGLVILSLRSKSEQLKAIGKVGIIPGFFGINEPVVFGTPIIFNPILAIPYILSSLIMGLLMWGGFAIGFLKPSYILILSLMPMGVGQFLSTMSVTNAIFPFLMIPVSLLIYYPFFKVYEKQLIEQETKAKESHL